MAVRLLLVTLCLFSQLSLQAQQVQSLQDLKNGDWFTLEYTQFTLSPEGNQSLRYAEIFTYLITLTDRTGNDLHFAISPIRVRFNETVYTGYFHFFDSYYCNDFVLSEPVYVGSNDVVTFKFNLQTGLLSDTTYLLDKEGWLYTKEMIFDGIRKKSPLFTGYSSRQTAAKPFFEAVIHNYFTNCNPCAPLPWLLEGPLANDTTYRVQMTGASFPLAPNVKIRHLTSEKLTADDLVLEVNERKYELQQEDNGVVKIEIFLPYPALGKMINKPIAITPGDSISIQTDANGVVTYSGRGADNCLFWYGLSKHQPHLDKPVQSSPLEPCLSLGDSIFQTLHAQYASQMSPYWRESAQLSFQYWYMSKVLEANRFKNETIDF